MSRAEQSRFLHHHHRGLILGRERRGRRAQRLSLEESYRHLALVAPTGSGKTLRYVIPNILAAEGSIVVTDPSGEIYAKTEQHLRHRGFLIQALRPADVEQSARFNPLAFWKTSRELRQLATQLGTSIHGQRSDPFWTTSAVNVLWFGLAALMNSNRVSDQNLGRLRWLLNHFGGQGDQSHQRSPANREVDAFMKKNLPDEHALAEYTAFTAQDSRILTSILATARAALELWADPDIRQLTATNTIDLTALRKRKTAIYLIVPEHQVRYFGLLLNLFYSACFAHCLETGSSESDLPVFFFLDEFGNLGAIHNFAAVITTLRKRRCSLSLILQDLAQLRTVYGADEAKTIFSGGCNHKLFFSGLDLETATYVERTLGQNTAYDTQFGGVNYSTHPIGVPLMRADEVRRLPRDQAILLSGRERPVRLGG